MESVLMPIGGETEADIDAKDLGDESVSSDDDDDWNMMDDEDDISDEEDDINEEDWLEIERGLGVVELPTNTDDWG